VSFCVNLPNTAHFMSYILIKREPLTPVPINPSATHVESGLPVYVTFHDVFIGPSRKGEYWNNGDWSKIVKLCGLRSVDILRESGGWREHCVNLKRLASVSRSHHSFCHQVSFHKEEQPYYVALDATNAVVME
jgi:hypothetical protein